MLTNVAITTVAWLVVTMLTSPEPREKLVAFYQKVRPAGPGWKPIAAIAGDLSGEPRETLTQQFVNWLLGCTMIYTTLFGIGKVIFKDWTGGAIYLAIAVVAAGFISRNLVASELDGACSERVARLADGTHTDLLLVHQVRFADPSSSSPLAIGSHSAQFVSGLPDQVVKMWPTRRSSV